eukprot:m.235264 g.235264  ORF g.235264 m.235264 type:complete len:183 (-) comp18923_c0_seq17:252-800(-)
MPPAPKLSHNKPPAAQSQAFSSSGFCREIATISYRSGPEWEMRFDRDRVSDTRSFRPDFSIESYLDYQGTQWCTRYDPNSVLYLTKAMDMFDMGDEHASLKDGLAQIRCPVLVLGVQSDILFPITQQRQLTNVLRAAGNKHVTYYELDAIYGHDTFLIDVVSVGSAIKGHLEHSHQHQNHQR